MGCLRYRRRSACLRLVALPQCAWVPYVRGGHLQWRDAGCHPGTGDAANPAQLNKNLPGIALLQMPLELLSLLLKRYAAPRGQAIRSSGSAAGRTGVPQQALKGEDWCGCANQSHRLNLAQPKYKGARASYERDDKHRRRVNCPRRRGL